MLILTRRPGERIVINDDLFISLFSVRGKNIKIGIEGDLDKYIIDREEVSLRKKKGISHIKKEIYNHLIEQSMGIKKETE